MRRTVQRWLANLGDDRIRSSPPLRIVASALAMDAGDGDAARLGTVGLAGAPPERRLGQSGRRPVQSPDGSPACGARATSRRRAAPHLCTRIWSSSERPMECVRRFGARCEHVHRWRRAGDRHAARSVVRGRRRTTDHVACAWRRDPCDRPRPRRQPEQGRRVRVPIHRPARTAPRRDLPGNRPHHRGRVAPRRARGGHLEDASRRIESSLHQLDGLGSGAPWYQLLGLVTLVRTCLLIDDAQMANDLFRRIETSLGIQDESAPFAAYVDELRNQVRVATDLLADRSWTLTEAELRCHPVPADQPQPRRHRGEAVRVAATRSRATRPPSIASSARTRGATQWIGPDAPGCSTTMPSIPDGPLGRLGSQLAEPASSGAQGRDRVAFRPNGSRFDRHG